MRDRTRLNRIFGWLFWGGLLLLILLSPEYPFLDKPVAVGSALALMLYERMRDRPCLLRPLPLWMVWVLPVGLALFTATRIQWSALEANGGRIILGFGPLLLYLLRFAFSPHLFLHKE